MPLALPNVYKNQASSYQLQVRFQDLFPQTLQHSFCLVTPIRHWQNTVIVYSELAKSRLFPCPVNCNFLLITQEFYQEGIGPTGVADSKPRDAILPQAGSALYGDPLPGPFADHSRSAFQSGPAQWNA